MFTGIIRNLGEVERFEVREGGARLTIRPESPLDLERGESIAISGVCLTALPGFGDFFVADLSDETLSRTTLGTLRAGDLVNIERAMTLEDRLGGHLVQGHVDTVGTLVEMKHDGEFAVWRWSYPKEYERLVVEKGSIAVDGVSLTIVEPRAATFGVALIPETLSRTNFQRAATGQRFNLEFDVMAKYVERLLAPYLERLGAS